jgi:hypothetical protein
MVPRCAQDVVGTIGPLVMGDGRGPWFWTLPDGRGGWADSVEGAWEGMERARLVAELRRGKQTWK